MEKRTKTLGAPLHGCGGCSRQCKWQLARANAIAIQTKEPYGCNSVSERINEPHAKA